MWKGLGAFPGTLLQRARSASTISSPPISPVGTANSADVESPSPLQPPQEVDSLAQANAELISTLEALQIADRSDYSERLRLILMVQQIITSESGSRHAFRQHGGYLTIISVLASLEETNAEEAGDDTAELRAELRYELVARLFSVLALSFEGMQENRMAFAKEVGYDAVEAAIKLSGLMKLQAVAGVMERKTSDGSEATESAVSSDAFVEAVEGSTTPGSDASTPSPAERMLSILYSFLVNDFVSTPIYTSIRLRLAEPPADLAPSEGPESLSPNPSAVLEPVHVRIASLLVERSLESPGEVVENAEVIALILSLLKELSSEEQMLRAMVLESISTLACTTRRSQIALAGTPLLQSILERMYSQRKVEDVASKRVEVRRLCRKLLEMGAGMKETKFLFQNAIRNWQEKDGTLDDEILDILLVGAQSRLPPFFHFDHSLHGHSSLSLPSLGRTFPPINFGYSYLAWISIESAPKTDDEKLIVFGCSDAASRCFLELSVSPSLQLCFATVASRPALPFLNFTFELGQFYHIAIVHQRSKISSTSTVSLCVNGRLVETAKAYYPSSAVKDSDVRAWIGTPEDRVASGMLGKGRSSVKWDLGPSWLVEGELPEEMVFVVANLGPRYTGNFQDRLGVFQTSDSSTLLNLRLDSNKKKPSPTSPLFLAIQNKGSAVLPEHRLYFSLSALNTLQPDDVHGIASAGLSQAERKNLAESMASKGTIVVDSAIPRLEDALVLPQGLFSLKGEPVVARPQSFDIGVATLGGIAVVLRLVELAATEKQLTTSVMLFFELVSDSWRNSEDAERIQGYEILALHLRQHASLITPATHDAMFKFVGYDLDDPAKSIVSNSLACRFLLLDLRLWNLTDSAIQLAHFARLRTLIDDANVNKEFNLRRLLKMHLTRKLLFALRMNDYESEMQDEVLATLMLVLESHWTTETIRHEATFLTATLCSAGDQDSAPIDSPIPCDSFVLDVRRVDSAQCTSALRVLEKLHDFLLSADKSAELAKFAKVVTTKWILLFLLDKTAHPLAAVYVLRILVRLLQAGPIYETKFSADSFSALREGLPQHLWNYPQIHLALLALLHDHDISTLPLDAPFSVATFETSNSPATSNRFGQDVYRIILGCLGRGIQQANVGPPVVDTDSPADNHRIPLVDGFKTVLELLLHANKPTTDSTTLATSPLSILQLVNSIRSFLPLSSAENTAVDLLLPLLSSYNSYRLSGDTVEVPAEQDSSNKEIPSLLAESATPANEQAERLAMLLLEFVGNRVGEAIVAGNGETKRLRSGSDATPIDTGLRVLHEVLDAIRCDSDMAHQIAFRTLLLRHVSSYLHTTTLRSSFWTRIASYVDFVTGLSFQGLNADILSILDLVLSSIEKLLDGNGGNATSSLKAASLGSLFRSLNRLVLLSLVNLDEANLTHVLPLLTRHQLIIFAGQNCDVDFFRCFVARLDTIVASADSTQEHVPAIELFKLLILERSVDVESAFGVSYYHDSEARLIDKLINSDNATFTTLLAENRVALSSSDQAWESFIETEVLNARREIAVDAALVQEKTSDAVRQQELKARRTRKQQAAIYEWAEGIHDVEATRVAHTKQDILEHSLFVESQWVEQLDRLQRDGGLWGATGCTRWRLDFTEGHSRMRIKLQPDEELSVKYSSQPDTDSGSPPLRVDRQDSMSVWPKQTPTMAEVATPAIPQEETIWNETALDTTDTPPDAPIEVESIDVVEEDKNRKVRRSLEPGDVIVAVFNVYRIVGLDACAGLLLLAEKNIYLVDEFFQKASGEVVDASDAPEEERDQHLQTLADLANRHSKSPTTTTTDSAHQSRRWSYSELSEAYLRCYLFRNVGLELCFSDGRSFLLTFLDTEQRTNVYELLAKKCPPAVEFGSLYVAEGSLGSKLTGLVRGQQTKLDQMTKRWQRREVSNFDYLMFINACAGRTYNDLSNYPVFPWILADYTSDTLDLADPATFRDLSKPMGAQTEPRRSEFQDRYAQLVELSDEATKPFHYGTHYSSAMIVVGFLVRLRPFTASYLALQGGKFDHADRMFSDIASAWESCSNQSRSDVRELIPEFFFLFDFLENNDGLNLGERQEDGTNIDTVKLPPWAHGNPRLFIERHREALESDYVSQHLHKWIDLIFGFRQTGSEAVDAVNVFHHLSYEGAIDLDAIENENEREAATSTIHNFGMTPRQLFTKPHPSRIVPLLAQSTIPLFSPDSLIEAQSVALVQCIAPVASIGRQTIFLPNDLKYFIAWTFTDRSLRLFASNTPSAPIDVYEGLHSAFITACSFADSKILITGSTDATIMMWKWSWKTRGKAGNFERLACLTGHSGRIGCIASSRSFSIIVSGSDDGTAIVWDLNRRRLVRRLDGHDAPVHLVAISDTTGDIATCSGTVLRVWSVNGALLATHPTSKSDPITALAFSTSEISPIIATGHRGGKIVTWRRVHSLAESAGWRLEQIASLQSKNRLSPSPSPFPDITSLIFTARTLYAGDSSGDVWLWAFCSEINLESGSCMNCDSAFGLIETRRRCSACAGVFCSTCSTTSIEIGGRFCLVCFSFLSPLSVLVV